jgi:hypothetical protein
VLRLSLLELLATGALPGICVGDDAARLGPMLRSPEAAVAPAVRHGDLELRFATEGDHRVLAGASLILDHPKKPCVHGDTTVEIDPCGIRHRMPVKLFLERLIIDMVLFRCDPRGATDSGVLTVDISGRSRAYFRPHAGVWRLETVALYQTIAPHEPDRARRTQGCDGRRRLSLVDVMRDGEIPGVWLGDHEDVLAARIPSIAADIREHNVVLAGAVEIGLAEGVGEDRGRYVCYVQVQASDFGYATHSECPEVEIDYHNWMCIKKIEHICRFLIMHELPFEHYEYLDHSKFPLVRTIIVSDRTQLCIEKNERLGSGYVGRYFEFNAMYFYQHVNDRELPWYEPGGESRAIGSFAV